MADLSVNPRDVSSWADPHLQECLATAPAAVLKRLGIDAPPGLSKDSLLEVVRVVSILWVEGRLVPRDKFHIDPFDEGLLFGRGIWESTRTNNGVPWLWPLHLDRLLRTAELLDIPIARDRLPTAKQVTDYVRSLTDSDVVIRLNVTAGRHGKPGMVWASAWVQQATPAAIRLKTRRRAVAEGQPYFIWKTFQYASRLRVGQEAWEAGFDSALLLDADDNLLEAAHANLFVRLPEGWSTPSSDSGLLLPGTVRQFLLTQGPLKVREQTIPAARLGEVREAFVTNSNAGVIPVTQIDQQTYPVGSETRDLLRWLQPHPPTGKNVFVVA